ncbi:acyl--CoA ligase [Haladaptatus sp. AB618]|uniref:class I adenylate-forming enzyme family protein n=1 Tax=Haladaptatus sp. AB618 TaxID=2934173 RepID=UPI00209BEA37|nr:class I adenylate-forming enzyme family protein [Haladaptatus sp. AB618]MCO8256700.1 acyl--CoA ligase [Haladaptatus sp. AB618]
MLFPQLFRQSVARTPDTVAIVNLQSGREFTYRELADQVYSLANGLRERGIGCGDRVAVCMGNRPENAMVFLATQFVGAVAVPFNFRVAPGGVEYHVADSDADVLLYDDLSREAVEAAVDSLDSGRIYVGDDPPSGTTAFDSLLDASADEPEIVPSSEDPSVILYSSGTTGDPKGILLDHRATTGRTLVNAMGQRYYLGETLIGVMPLYHTVGLHGVLCAALSVSGTYLCMPEFDPERCVRSIPEWNVSALHEAPTIFNQYLETDAIDEADVSSVRAVGYSGAPMSSNLFDRVVDVFDPEHITNQYGTTEAFGTTAHAALDGDDNPAMTGPANLFYEVRIVELDGTPDDVVERGTEGELIVNTDSPLAFDGYLNKPERTAEAVRDGWFFTGDAARRTEDGNIVLTGRADDMLISGGENIHPENVEDVLVSHPKIRDVGVIGAPHDNWGEIVKAYVVADDGLSAAELDDWCLRNDDLADFKRPREYAFVDELPRNPSGKILRYELRELE